MEKYCTHRSSLFLLKFGAIKVVFCHCCRKIDVIKTVSNRVFIGYGIIAMYQIKMTVIWDFFKQYPTPFHFVPAHVRYIACGCKPYHFSIKDSQARCISLFGTVTHQLHSQTNSQYRLCQTGNKCIQLGAFEFRHRRARFPYAWKNYMRSRLNGFWITRQCSRNSKRAKAKRILWIFPAP